MAEAIELHSGLHIAPAEAYLPESGDLNISPEDGGHSLPQCDGGVVAWRLLWTICLLYTSPSPRDRTRSRMPSSA